MPSSRATLLALLAAFLTFLLALAGILVLVKPELDRRRSDDLVSPAPGADRASATPAGARGDDGGTAGSKKAERDLHVRGRIVDARGEPISSARVLVFKADGLGAGATGEPLARARADLDGRFVIETTVPAGAFAVALADGFVRTGFIPLRRTPGGGTDLGEISLRTGGTLSVRVSGDEAGVLEGARVELVDATAEPEELRRATLTARSDASGLAVVRGLDSGTYAVSVVAPGHADAALEWNYDGALDRFPGDLAFVLLPLRAQVTGTVVDRDLAPVTDGEVIARLVNPEPPSAQEWRAAVRADGSFSIGPVPSGTFALELLTAGMVQRGEAFADGDGPPVEIVAEHGGVVSGRLIAPVDRLRKEPSVTVWRCELDGREQPFTGSFRASADPQALTFRIVGLGPGRYRARVSAGGFAPARSEPFQLRAGGSCEDLAVVLGDGASLRGTVVDARGAAIADARVTVFEGRTPPPPALVDLFPADARAVTQSAADGRFELFGLSPGANIVVIEASGQPARTLGPILLAEGDWIETGTLALAGGAVITVTAIGPDGGPAPHTAAWLRSEDAGCAIPFLTDGHGSFCARGVAPGSFELAAERDGAPLERVAVEGQDAARVELRLPPIR